MSTPESVPSTPGLDAESRVKQDDLTQRVGKRLAAADPKASWWKRLLGRG